MKKSNTTPSDVDQVKIKGIYLLLVQQTEIAGWFGNDVVQRVCGGIAETVEKFYPFVKDEPLAKEKTDPIQQKRIDNAEAEARYIRSDIANYHNEKQR